MKLGKKNKVTQEQGTEVSSGALASNPQPNKANDTSSKAKQAPKSRTLNSWIAQPITGILLSLALLYLLLEWLVIQPVEEQHQQILTQTQAQTVERVISSYFKTQLQWLESVSAVIELENDQMNAILQATKPELYAIQAIPVSTISQLNPQNTQFSFAGLDLLRRTAKAESTTIEAFLQDKQWLFQIARPIYAEPATAESEAAQAIKGVVLAIFDFSALEKIVSDKQQTYNGQISLLSKGVSKPIVQLGQGELEHEVAIPAAMGQWTIKFAPDKRALMNTDRTNLWFVVVLAALVLVILMTFIVRLNMKKIQRDLQSVVRMVSKSIESDARFLNNFYFGEVFVMANAIVGRAREVISQQKARVAKLKNVKVNEEKTVEITEDEPLFDEDLFDIDELDLNEGHGMRDDASKNALVQEKPALNEELSPSIFRAYDIRGIVDETLNPQIVRLLGKSIASEALQLGQATMCLGYDGRLSSAEYCEAFTEGALSTGIKIIVIGRVPTPVLYFATHHFETGTGVMITGSHNPVNYNGFKVMLAGNSLHGDAIQKLYQRILTQDFMEGQGERIEQTVDHIYIDTILNDIAVAAPLKVVIDAGNGMAGILAPELIEELGCEVIPIHCEVDGRFPNHHPDPGKPENLQDLIAAVKEHQADIGLAFDGDGDRLGVVTNTGKIIWPDRLLMLFARDVVSRNPGADIIYDVKCSRRLNGLISSFGGRPVMWKTGHSLIKAKLKESGALLAGEMSGHIFFKERWYGFDDGLYSAARLLEILGVEDKSSDDVFAEFPEDISTPELNVAVTDKTKFEIVEKLCARREQFVGGNVSVIDGIRVDYPNGWGLCRASNTTPVLVMRFEADDQASLDEIKNKFIVQLKQIDPTLQFDF